LTGARAGWVLSSENGFRGADAVGVSGTQHVAARQRECRHDLAESTTPSTYGTSLYGNREVLWWPARWTQAEIWKPTRRRS
jgi:hypothetical protein